MGFGLGRPSVNWFVVGVLWMDEIHFAPLGNHGKPLFVGIYRGIMVVVGKHFTCLLIVV